jgi:hypothetical protein
MIEKPGYAIGNQKIVKFFEHKGREYVRLEDQVGWNLRDVLLTFHLARIAYFLFPDNIPYPRLIRKSNRKEGTYSIFAEYIPHDKDHEYITKRRNENIGGSQYLKVDESNNLREMVRKFEESESTRTLREKFKSSGLIGNLGGGYELIKQNVIIRGREPVFIDFVNPFSINGEDEENATWISRVDFVRIFDYCKSHSDESSKIKILAELRQIYKWIPKRLKQNYSFMLNSRI